jgi:hypothetical protein
MQNFGFLLPKQSISQNLRTVRMFRQKFGDFAFHPNFVFSTRSFRFFYFFEKPLTIVAPGFKRHLATFGQKNLFLTYRNFGSTIYHFLQPKLRVRQKYTKFLPKNRKSGIREILQNLGLKKFTVYF